MGRPFVASAFIIFYIYSPLGLAPFVGRTRLSCNRNVCVPLQPKFRITNAITGNLTRIERARGFLAGFRVRAA